MLWGIPMLPTLSKGKAHLLLTSARFSPQTCWYINLQTTPTTMNCTSFDSTPFVKQPSRTGDWLLALHKCSPGTPICATENTQDLDTQLRFMSVFFNLDKNSRSLQGFRDCCFWEEFSHMKEQLDEMNIPSRPGCRFWYSYRHTTGRRLNKHYSSVKNMTSRCSSSAALTSGHHKSGHDPPVCTLNHFLLMILPPLPYMGLFFSNCMYACTLSPLTYEINICLLYHVLNLRLEECWS